MRAQIALCARVGPFFKVITIPANSPVVVVSLVRCFRWNYVAFNELGHTVMPRLSECCWVLVGLSEESRCFG
jgi:hypothetical protein